MRSCRPRRRVLGRPLAVAASIALLTGCKTIAKGDRFERQLAEHFEAHGHTVVVRCPDQIPLAHVDRNRFSCDVASADGSSATFLVKLDGAGTTSLELVAGTARAPTQARPEPPRLPVVDDGDPWR